MPTETIISGKGLPAVTRNADGSVDIARGGRSLVIPPELADNSTNDAVNDQIREIIVESSRGYGDAFAGLVLVWELTRNGFTLGQAADNQGTLRTLLETATYEVTRTTP